ncbi:hypothetical protein CC80DRAFT_406955 [Byssothecium circinans]|uniref:Uncharacterized protein n=1 Tax=Byssothecium circinans TaxID=147558 RepID=A0A6A5U2X1_9PLEO|nr:hypothetical protein CC80DRAFT_406955 [Byssothecium circinans]
MRELYDHVNITISIPNDDMEAYLNWALEREHGDLGLKSTAKKPPLSSLGLSLRKRNEPELIKTLVSDIKGLATGHIAIAKARLDLLHDARSVEDIMQKRYQLPASNLDIVSMFDAAVKAVEAQDPLRGSLGLQAIAAAGRDPDGIEIPYLRELLNQSNRTRVRSGEDILTATRGLLTAPVGFKPQSLHIFGNTFNNYVVERYNDSIYRADQQLPQENSLEEMDNDTPVAARDSPEPHVLSEEPNAIMTSETGMTDSSIGSDDQTFIPTYIIRKGTRMWI